MKLIKHIFIFFSLLTAFSISLLANSKFMSRDSITPTTAFILSGGGARGAAQVGILMNFEDNLIEPDFIVGTSIGSIVGGLYASGVTAKTLENIISNPDWHETFAVNDNEKRSDLFLDQKINSDKYILDLRFKNFKFMIPQAISLGHNFNLFLNEIFWDALFKSEHNFDSLKYKLRVVATDLVSGKSVSFKEGSLVQKIRASSTVPLRYTPVQIDSGIYVDGGILSNIPIHHSDEFKPDIKVVFNTTSPLLERDELNAPWNIADQAISIAMKKIEDEALKKADIIIFPDLGKHKNSDFSGLDSLIRIGYESATNSVEKYKILFEKIKKQKINNYLEIFYRDKSSIYVTFNNLDYADSIFTKNNYYSKNELVDLIYNLWRTIIYEGFSLNINHDTLIISAKHYKQMKYLDIKGNYPGFLNSTIREISDFKQNAPINDKLLKYIKSEINKKFREKGYSAGSVLNIEVIKDTVYLKVGSGIIQNISIYSEEGTNKDLILRDLTFQENDFFNSTEAAKSWNNLSKSDLFSNVKFSTSGLESDSITVQIETTETGTQSIKIGARIDNERNSQIAFEANQNNILNLGAKFSIGFDGGTHNQKPYVKLSNQRILKTLIFNELFAYYHRRDFYQYFGDENANRNEIIFTRERNFVEERYGATFTLGRQIQKSGIFSGTYRWEKQRVYHMDSSSIDDFEPINTITIKTVFDTRNKNSFATKGSTLLLSLETNLSSGSKIEGFSKAIFDMKYYQSFSNHTFIPKIIFGAADQTLPNAEFFNLGGDESFYGMREDQERGRQIFVSSLEYRYKIPLNLWFDTYFSLRYDIGSTWFVPENVKFSTLKHGIGARLSWDTPIGPATVSVGRSFKFLKDPAAISRSDHLLYFTIGMQL